jgi:folate-binding protein YgfZ
MGNPTLACILSPEGRPKALFWIQKELDALRLHAAPEELLPLKENVELFHFGEKIELVTVEECFVGFELLGLSWPQARLILSPPDFQNSTSADWAALRAQNLLVERGMDFKDQENVFELGLDEICESNKGCYVGQEVIERVRSRGGAAAKRIALIEFSAPILAEEGLFKETQKVGHLTKTVFQHGVHYLGLGMVSRGFCKIGESLTTESSNHSGVLVKVTADRKTSLS